MKVFFNFSGRSSPQVISNCKIIYDCLIQNGLRHTFDSFNNDFIDGEKNCDQQDIKKLYDLCNKSILKSNLIVLELSTNSFTQGFILQRSLELHKPVIALYLKGTVPIFAESIKSDLLHLVEYNDFNLKDILKQSINLAKDRSECRFNFYLSYDILNYLKYISKKNNKSKSAYIRDLLEEKMVIDQEYLH